MAQEIKIEIILATTTTKMDLFYFICFSVV